MKFHSIINRLCSRSYTNIYLSGTWGWIWYPYRMQPAHRYQEWVRDNCMEYVVDSGYSKPEITNDDVLEAAEERHANWVVPKDYPANEENGLTREESRRKTTKSTREFLDKYREQSGCTARVLIPLQPPYHVHYQDFPDHCFYALGGKAHDDKREFVEEVKKFREVAGYNVYAHAFGAGLAKPIIKAVRDDPHLLDSVDTSTPIQHVQNYKIADKFQRVQDYAFPEGYRTNMVKSFGLMLMLAQLNYVCGPWCDDDDLEKELGELANPGNLLDI